MSSTVCFGRSCRRAHRRQSDGEPRMIWVQGWRIGHRRSLERSKHRRNPRSARGVLLTERGGKFLPSRLGGKEGPGSATDFGSARASSIPGEPALMPPTRSEMAMPENSITTASMMVRCRKGATTRDCSMKNVFIFVTCADFLKLRFSFCDDHSRAARSPWRSQAVRGFVRPACSGAASANLTRPISPMLKSLFSRQATDESPAAVAGPVSANGARRRVMVIGLDCAAPELVFDRWLDDLPNLKSLYETDCTARCVRAIHRSPFRPGRS